MPRRRAIGAMSGHAIHFLRRLERASTAQTELALSLYRDTPLVQFILARARLPADAERVALSLDPADRGPYVIVTQEGRFVTCLGRDMRCDLPLLEHARLQAIIALMEGYRDRIKLAQELTGDETLGSVFTTLRRHSDRASREDFLAASALQPFMRHRLLLDVYQQFDDLVVARHAVLKIKRPRKRDTELLRLYWESAFYMSALLPLFAMGGPAGIEELLTLFERQEVARLTWPLIRQADLLIAHRAIWAAGRLGRSMLSSYKRYYREATTPLAWIDSLTALLVIAVRNVKLRAEIHKTVTKLSGQSQDVLYFIRELPKEWARVADYCLQRPEVLLSASSETARKRLVRYGKHWGLPPPYDYRDAGEVPADLACSLSANFYGDFLNQPDQLVELLAMIPWLARVDAPELFLPADFLAAVPDRWQPDDTLRLVRRLEAHYGKPQPTRRPARKVGRNAPCPCGSGKKHKHCCLGKQHDPLPG